MRKDILPSHRNRNEMATGVERIRWLLNLRNGRVLAWTPILAVDPRMIDCDIDGNPIDPKSIAGDDPYILEQTRGVAARMKAAGATDETLEDFGNFLADRAAGKFRALASDKRPEVRQIAEMYATDAAMEAYGIKKDDELPFMERLERKIERMAAAAMIGIHMMANEARRRIDGVRL